MNAPIIAYRANMGVQTAAPFLNTYSLDFDGVDDYVSAPQSFLNSASVFSVSFWAKKVLASDDVLIGDKISTFQGMWVNWYTDGNVYFTCRTGGNITLVAALSFDTNWHHFLCTKNGTDAKIYIDGVLSAITPTDGTVASTLPATCGDNFRIGSLNASTFGKSIIDEVALWDSVIPIGDVWDGSGAATDLSLLATPPTNWYRNGDNGSYKSPQWLIPNNENKDKVSNYSFDFDGVDETIFCGIDASRQVQTLTMSVWVKPTAFARDGIVLNGHVSYGNQGIEIYWNFNQFGVRINGSTYGLGSGNGQNNWSHILVAYDGNTLKRMTNGVPLADVVIGATINYTNYNGLTIGRSPYGFHIGNIDEFAFWNSDQSANFSTIYGTGVPNDLTDLSPIAWYRMGEEATFSGGVWTVPDQVGSNDGTSNAMTIEDRVGEAPNSENNALSFNMDLVDRTTDVPT